MVNWFFATELAKHGTTRTRSGSHGPLPKVHLTEFSCSSIHPKSSTRKNLFGTAVAKSTGLIERRFFVIKTYLALALSVAITFVSLGLPLTAKAQSNSEIDKIRSKVHTLSVSKGSQVEVKFRDRTKLKGYIDSVEPVTFTLRDPKNGSTQSIAYSEVDSISKAGNGVSTKTLLIVGGIAAGTVTTWLIVKPAVCDGGAQTRGIC